MKLLAYENFPLASVIKLRQNGFDITSIGKDCPGISDEEVMQIAISEERLILTFDRDYGELIFKFGYKPKAGVIFIRWHEFYPSEPGEFLIDLFQTYQIEFEHQLTVIDRNSIRQRKY